jgi:hypothetical protein
MARPRARMPHTCTLPTPFAMSCPCFVFAGGSWQQEMVLVIRAGAKVLTRRPNEVVTASK